MIRIDEIYTLHLIPWLQQIRPDVRAIWFDPFGRTDTEAVQCQTRGSQEQDYVVFFDQEPLQPDLHAATFDHVQQVRCADLPPGGHIITSEWASDAVQKLCQTRGWRSHYYWFHGWAALDWYRGYNRTRLQVPATARTIKHTFVAPNRIIGGARQHRLIMLYWIFRYGLVNNHISCPSRCPAEQLTVEQVIEPLSQLYPDMSRVFDCVDLPLNMPGESGHPMMSCWLDLWQPLSESLLYLVTETVATGRRQHLTEKTLKPIAQAMPFVVVGTQGSLAYLRKYGFQTFDTVWDESYDDVEDDHERMACIARLLRDLDGLSLPQRQELFEQCRPIVEHNYDHFYSGGFEAVLWQELTGMMQEFAL